MARAHTAFARAEAAAPSPPPRHRGRPGAPHRAACRVMPAADRWTQPGRSVPSACRGASMDRLEAMAMLVSSVEEGSLSAAARKLRVPVATLTRNVNDLEAAVGTKLLVRTTRKLELTDAGTEYIASAK